MTASPRTRESRIGSYNNNIDSEKLFCDTALHCGQLIQDLHAQYGVEVLTPVKASPKRLVEFDAVPLEQYDTTVWGNVATLYTTMTDFDGPLRLLLKKRRDGKYFALLTPTVSIDVTCVVVYTYGCDNGRI